MVRNNIESFTVVIYFFEIDRRADNKIFCYIFFSNIFQEKSRLFQIEKYISKGVLKNN